MNKKVVDSRYAKSAEYRKVLQEIANQGQCPFCPKNFKHHKRVVLRRSGNWFITKNSWPYRNSRLHLVIIGTRHKERIEELTSRDFATILRLIKWATKKFDIEGGAFAMRFGETSYTGATVCHLHCHLIVPKLNRETKRAQTVIFPIG